MASYQLTAEDSDKQVTDIHLEELTHSHCGKWRYLPPHLGLDNTMKDDIDRKFGDEREKRFNFLVEWKDRVGAEATYRALINGLLKIGCKSDAEFVHQLIHPDPKTTAHIQSTEPSSQIPTSAAIETAQTTSTVTDDVAPHAEEESSSTTQANSGSLPRNRVLPSL